MNKVSPDKDISDSSKHIQIVETKMIKIKYFDSVWAKKG